MSTHTIPETEFKERVKNVQKLLAEKGIDSLPGDMGEAIAEFEKSSLVREVLGNHIFEKFIANKKIEWENYTMHVSQYELEKYMPIL